MSCWYRWIILVLVSLIGMNARSMENKEMKLLMDKPVFKVKFSQVHCPHGICVNGARVHVDFLDSGQQDLTLPVNHFMRSGSNELSFRVFPGGEDAEFKPSASLTAELWIEPFGKSELGVKIGGLSFKASDIKKMSGGASMVGASGEYNSEEGMCSDEKGDVELFDLKVEPDPEIPEGFMISRKFEIPNSLPLWGFFSGEDLADPAFMSDEELDDFCNKLGPEYMTIQDALSDGSKKAIKELMIRFEERNREYDLALYREPGTTEKMLYTDLYGDANDKNKTLARFLISDVGASRHENKKLVALDRNGLQAAIAFNYVSGSGCTLYDIIYYKKDGKWIISR